MKGNQMQQVRRGRSREGGREGRIRRRKRFQVREVEGVGGVMGAGSHQTSWTGSLPL